jgi:hypothetical protein
VIHRALVIAAENGERCRPVHLLAALAELDGPISAALQPPAGGALFTRPSDPPSFHGGAASYLIVQTQEAAAHLAIQRGETVGPEHLLLAVIDQADPEAMALLSQAGLDVGAVRRAALVILRASSDLAPIPIPPLIPAGTMDRPSLPVSELDPRAWAALCWRQDHLPLGRLCRRSQYEALHHLEALAADRLASKLDLDADQRGSLPCHHLEQVTGKLVGAHVELSERVAQPSLSGIPVGVMVTRRSGWLRHYRHRWLGFTVGWGAWFSNRRVGMRHRWFRLRTVAYYRGASQP